MIVDLPSTTTSLVSKKLIQLREDVGAMALTRVLTLIVPTDEHEVESAVQIAMQASRQHPCRTIVLGAGNARGTTRLDAQIRVGGDAGASEVVVLRLFGALGAHGRSVVTPLLLADSPIVAWWPGEPPPDPAHDPVGAIARRRITDASRARTRPATTLGRLAAAYAPGDSDLAWSRITLWRGILAAALDQAPYESVHKVVVTGAPDSPSTDLLAGWLSRRLRCPVAVQRSADRSGIVSVQLERATGSIELTRPSDDNAATLTQPGSPVHRLALPHRSDAECLADELRRLDPDETYHEALVRGLPEVTSRRASTRDKE